MKTQPKTFGGGQLASGDALSKSFSINLIAGENHLRAVAINSQRTESQPDEIILNYKPITPPSRGGRGGDLASRVVVGTNTYKNPKYNLNYALADATSFKEAMAEAVAKSSAIANSISSPTKTP